MEDESFTHSPPPKKICVDQNLPEPFTLEEVSKLLNVCIYRQELAAVNQELDLLDDITTNYIGGNVIEQSVKQESTTRSFALPVDHTRSTHFCIYIPPMEEELVTSGIQDSRDSNLPIKQEPVSSCPEIALDAKREASVLQQVARLHRKGLWSSDRLPKVMEPRFGKMHHVHLLNEALWLSTDFREERKWKKDMASRLARAAQVYLITRHEWNQQIQYFEEQLRMRNAARVAKMIKDWWSGINQSLDILRMKLHHKRWQYACKENQDSVVQFSDTSLSWWAALKFDFKNEKFQKPDLLQIAPDEKILSYVDGDGDMDDEDWKPEIESESSTVSDSCSSSTSSSLASSFLDDSDINASGVTPYSPSDPLSSEHYHSEMTTPIAFNQNDRQLGLEKGQKNQEMLPHDSDCESRDGSNASHNVSTEETQKSQASPEPGDTSVESIEVQHLVSDTKVPLNHLLETYLQQGLFMREKVKYEPGSCSSDSDTSNGEVGCHTYVELPKRIQEEISILQKEASVPLLEVLPAGYMNFLESSDTHKCPAECATLSPSQKGYHHLDESPQVDNKMDSGGGDPDSASSVSEASSLISGENNESDQLLQSEDACSTNSPMVYAPWCSSTLHSEPRHITDLHTAAVELLSLKLTSTANNDLMKYISGTCTVAHGPTLRIRSLPTPNFGAAVTWMRHAFARSVPVLLLTNSHLSGDAELAVAAHLGQLAVADPRYYMSSGYPSSEFANDTITGEWGPHLIVTPSLCLSAWRRRLQIWCPGLRVTCLGLAHRTDRSGTGHRLRDSVARGAVNICLVSYSALRSRPSRFTRIQWSSVVFDQMQHIILQSFKSSGIICTETPNRQRTIKKLHSQDFTQDVTSDCEAISCDDNVTDSLNTKQFSHWSIPKTSESIIRRKLEWFDLILNKLGRNGHRLLISSSADLIYHKHSPYLLDLSKLLLLTNLPDEENYRSWLNDFFEAVNLSASHRRPCSTSLLSKPSKKQLFKFLDPFVIRFDDEEEWDSFINEEVIECRMSTIQQKLHDAALSTKAAENAIKTGNLMDLLQTVSIAARTCSHPCLTGTQPKNSRIFRRTINNLQTRNNAAYGPCVFNSLEKICDSNGSCYPNSSLIFNTPESVLFGVKLLRQSELSYTSCQYFNLFESLKSSVYVRNRIASLTPQFIDLVSTPKKHFTPPSGNVSLSNSVSVPTNSSPVSHIPNGNSRDSHFKSENHLTNGLPQSEQLNSGNCIDPDIEFVSIPQRQKRQRENSIDHSGVSNKRRRIEDTDIPRPFLVHSNIQSSSYYHAYSNRSSQRLSCDSNISSDQLRNTNVSSNIVNHISNSSTHNVLSDSNDRSTDISVNANEYPWLKDNQRKCTQLTGFADWCSLDTCNMLRLHSTTTAMTSNINSSSENSSFQSYNVFAYEKESSIWNIVKNKFSLFWTNPSILCTRPRVIAMPARLTSRIGPVDRELFNKNKSSLSLIDIHCPHVSWPLWMHHSTVLKISQLLYPLTEQARLLSISSVPNIGFQPSLSSVILTKSGRDNRLSPLCRLFSESGKFYHLHQKLSNLLGVKLKGEKRPRCIYFIAHQTAFLDLLEAYLSVSSWRLLCRLRIPSDYQSVSANTYVLLDRINYWPYGTMGPLLVLIHARSPASLLVSLRADPSVHIIICDVDWRTEVTDNLKAIIHSWILNGLSTFPSSTEYNKEYNSGLQKVNTYRLLSSGDFGYSIPRMTVEACLLRGVACRLLPRAVFHAHSTTHVNRSSLLFARVQPNVVNGLLSGVYARKLTHRSFMQKIKSGEFDRLDIFNDRNFFTPIKQDTLSCSSTSSVASSFSCTGPDNRLDEFRNERTGEEDDVILFQEREPLSEQLLHRALELFEDPADTQAWCCTNAERKAIANEFIPIENEIDDYYSLSSNSNIDSDIEDDEDEYQNEDEDDDEIDDSEEDIIINDEFITSELNTDFMQSIEEYKENSQSDLSKQAGCSNLLEWEFGNYELLTRISDLEDQLYPLDSDWLTYHYSVHENFTPDQCEQQLQQPQDVESSSQTFPPSLTLFSQLPVWCPFESHLKYLHTESNASESSLLHLTNECELPLPGEDSNDWISSNLEFDWGYETVPMAESELPPLIIAPVVQNNITSSVTTTTTNNNTSSSITNNDIMDGQLARRRPIVNHSSLSSRSMNDNNVHISTYRSGSRLNNKNLKRRTLSTNINSSPRKTASYPTLDDSSTAHGDTNFTGASDENESRSQDNRVIGSQSSRDSTPSGGTTSTTTGGGSSCNVPPTSGASSANSYANNSIVLMLHSQGSNASGNSASLKLHIPRVSYNKDVTNARVHRLRRMNNINVVSGSDAAAAAMALAAGAQLFQQQQQQQQLNPSGLYHEHNQQLANAMAAATQAFSPWNSFISNPAVLARYGQVNYQPGAGNATPGRHLPSALQNLMQMSNTSQFPVMKYSAGGNGAVVVGAANFPLNNTSPSLVGINVNGQLNTPINNAGANTTAPMNNNSTQLANQLYVGKQPDWLIYEEAALYLCITKLLDLNFEMNNSTTSSGTSMPNYRFAEFFLNNYLPNRCFRGARQCLLAHFKMQNIIASANAAGVSTASTGGGGGSPLNSPFGIKPEEMSHPTTANAASGIPHGPSSRKVKNKMKSAAVAAAAAAAVAGMSMSSGGGGGPGCPGVVSGCGGNAAGANSAVAAAAALNRYRGYLFYQHLQTWFNMLPQNTSEGNNTQTESNPSVPPYLSPVIHAMIYNEDIQTSCLHKAIRDKLSVPSVQMHSTFRSSGSRRTGVSGNTGGNITGAAASSNLGYHSSGSGPSAGHYAHYGLHSSSSSSGSGQLSHNLTGHPASTAPALLTHHRHRHHSTYDHSQGQNSSVSTTEAGGGVIGSVSSLNSNTGSGTTVVHSGPIIQKNPTHIAALQEHNINPDTLITPAMVIKNKEEREARQRAEAAAAAAAALSASSQANASATSTSSQISTSSASADSGTSQSDAITSDPSNSQNTEGVGVNSQSSHPSSDHVIKTSANYTSASSESTTSCNLSTNSSTVPLPTTSISSGGRASAQLSFAHNLSQRANSVMLPIRSSFNSNTGTSSGTVLSFTGQQPQQRLISVQNTSSSPSTGHYQFQPRQTLLHSSVGRLTQLTPSGSISNTQHVSPSNSHHVISSSSGGSSSPDDNAPRNIDLTSSNILIPGNWRTASNSRSLNVQTIVSSTPTVLRRSSTFTGISLAGQSNSGLQTCRLNPATSSVSQSLSTASFTGTYMNTQIAKIPNSPSSSAQSNFYVQQRPQFLSTAQTSMSSPTRGVFTPPSNVAVIPSVSSSYSTPVTHLPQILRPRNTIRGSVVQPAFVRTIPVSSGNAASGGSGGSVVPVSTTQLGTRLSPSVGVSASNILHGRVTTLTVSSNNPSVANILNSRTGTQHSISPTVFQSLRTCISGGVNNPPGNNEQPHQSLSYGGSTGGVGGGNNNNSSSKS